MHVAGQSEAPAGDPAQAGVAAQRERLAQHVRGPAGGGQRHREPRPQPPRAADRGPCATAERDANRLCPARCEPPRPPSKADRPGRQAQASRRRLRRGQGADTRQAEGQPAMSVRRPAMRRRDAARSLRPRSSEGCYRPAAPGAGFSGAAETTVQSRRAGVASTCPVRSRARTSKEWDPGRARSRSAARSSRKTPPRRAALEAGGRVLGAEGELGGRPVAGACRPGRDHGLRRGVDGPGVRRGVASTLPVASTARTAKVCDAGDETRSRPAPEAHSPNEAAVQAALEAPADRAAGLCEAERGARLRWWGSRAARLDRVVVGSVRSCTPRAAHLGLPGSRGCRNPPATRSRTRSVQTPVRRLAVEARQLVVLRLEATAVGGGAAGRDVLGRLVVEDGADDVVPGIVRAPRDGRPG